MTTIRTIETATSRTSGSRSSIARRIATGLAITGATAALGVAGAGVASAQQYGTYALSPSTGQCTPAQYANYQVRGNAQATGEGAKFKLVRNGVVIANTPSRANYWVIELRSAYGTFPGPGYYALCAQNTGSSNTVATLQLLTDAEL